LPPEFGTGTGRAASIKAKRAGRPPFCERGQEELGPGDGVPADGYARHGTDRRGTPVLACGFFGVELDVLKRVVGLARPSSGSDLNHLCAFACHGRPNLAADDVSRAVHGISVQMAVARPM
jgi:hypothetical protein